MTFYGYSMLSVRSFFFHLLLSGWSLKLTLFTLSVFNALWNNLEISELL